MGKGYDVELGVRMHRVGKAGKASNGCFFASVQMIDSAGVGFWISAAAVDARDLIDRFESGKRIVLKARVKEGPRGGKKYTLKDFTIPGEPPSWRERVNLEYGSFAKYQKAMRIKEAKAALMPSIISITTNYEDRL